LQNAKIDTAPIVKRYRTWASITIGAIVLLILAGGIVRMTGSGMGCPDWPKCFGKWVPPTDVSELPTDYKTRFEVAGREIADFDAFKTWVEYINRLLGVLVGFFSIITAVLSFNVKKIIPSVFWLSIAGLLLVIIEGGIGAYVVRTHLHAGMITLHMVVALGIFAVYLSAILRASQFQGKEAEPLTSSVAWIAFALLAMSTVQIILGTQVRESIDLLAEQMGEAERANWIGNLGSVYDWHSMGHYSILALFVWLSIRLKDDYPNRPMVKYLIIAIGGSLALEIMVGLGMHYLGLPAVLQPIHLLLASILFGAEFLLVSIYWIQSGRAETDKIDYDRQRDKEIFSP